MVFVLLACLASFLLGVAACFAVICWWLRQAAERSQSLREALRATRRVA